MLCMNGTRRNWKNGKRRYFYGTGLPAAYNGPVPDAWNYNIEKEFLSGKYTWNEEECPCYQRHYPEVLGYQVLRPVKRKELP